MQETRPAAFAKDAAFYDDGWPHEWADMKRYSPMARHTRRWIRKLLRQIPAPRSIADVGCGEGSLLAELGRLYPQARLFGADFSEVSVCTSRRRIPRGTFAVSDVRDPQPPFDEAVDVAVISEVLEHVDEDQKAIANLAKWCRHLIVTVPGGRLDELAERMGHLRHFDVPMLRERAERGGFDVLFCRAWGAPFAYPLYARLRNRAGYATVTASYGLAKRMVSHGLYALFYLNDFFPGGNKVFLLGRSRQLAGDGGN